MVKKAEMRYLRREISPLGSALVMQGNSFHPTKDDVLGDLNTQALQA